MTKDTMRKNNQQYKKKIDYNAPEGYVEQFAFSALIEKILDEEICYSIYGITQRLADQNVPGRSKLRHIYRNNAPCPEEIYDGLVRLAMQNRNGNGSRPLDDISMRILKIPIEYDASKEYDIGQILIICREVGVVVGKKHKNRIIVAMKNGESRKYAENVPDDPGREDLEEDERYSVHWPH